MSSETEAQNEVLAEAERINEERMAVMRDLAENVGHRRDLERQVREAEKEERRLTSAAEKAGWTRRQVQRIVKPPKQQKSSSTDAPAGQEKSDSQLAEPSVNTETSQHTS